MDTVAKELRSWLLERNVIHISINVPPEIVGRSGLQYVAKASGLSDVADKLMIEITERGVLDFPPPFKDGRFLLYSMYYEP